MVAAKAKVKASEKSSLNKKQAAETKKAEEVLETRGSRSKSVVRKEDVKPEVKAKAKLLKKTSSLPRTVWVGKEDNTFNHISIPEDSPWQQYTDENGHPYYYITL